MSDLERLLATEKLAVSLLYLLAAASGEMTDNRINLPRLKTLLKIHLQMLLGIEALGPVTGEEVDVTACVRDLVAFVHQRSKGGA